MKKLLISFLLFTFSISAQTYVGNVLSNPGFEDTTAAGKAKWVVYPADYASFAYEEEGTTMFGSSRQFPSYWGNWGIKLWGRYNGAANENSFYQQFVDVPAGKVVTYTALSMTYNEDRIRGENQSFLFIKTFDANWNLIKISTSDSMSVNVPADRWLGFGVEQTIPTNTKYTQIGIGYYQKSNDDHGGVYWDDHIAYIGDQLVDIAVNTSHIKNLTQRGRKMMVDLRGGSVGTGTGVIANPAWGAGTNLRPASAFHWSKQDSADFAEAGFSKHLEHDWWYLPIALDKALAYDYKFGGHIANLDGTISGYWENDLPGADYQGNNRNLTISADGSSSTATGAYSHNHAREGSDEPYLASLKHFLGRGTSNDNPPFTNQADSVDVYFVVNMSNNLDFDGSTQKVYMAGDLESEVTGGNDWSHGIEMKDIGDGYWAYHWRGAKSDDQPDTLNYKFTLGDWSGTHEDGLKGEGIVGGNRQVIVGGAEVLIGTSGDATVPWVWYNNNAPSPFTESGKVPSITFRTNIGQAVANNGWKADDHLIVKWGYGRTAKKVYQDTLTAGVGGDYQVTIAPTDGQPVDDKIGMYYQYYRGTGGSDSREIFFNFDSTWKDVSLQERRWTPITAGAAVTIVDYVNSGTHGRRLPIFRNSAKLDAAAADTDSLLVTWTVDLRPIYYTLLSFGSDAADSLKGIQGARTLYYSDRNTIFDWGVWMNGPAIGGWNARGAWGAGLRGDALAKMHDDGATGGDATAGDSIYTVQFKYQKNSTDVGMEFKFGVNAEDNESGFGLNHIENIDINNPTVASQFGSINPKRYSGWNFDKGRPGSLNVEELVGVPGTFELSNNYPNPFNPTTSINFNVPIASEVILTIYNITGQEVAKVHNGFAQPGAYKAVWNGMDHFGNKAPSGVYFYELKAENHFHQVKKMTLLK